MKLKDIIKDKFNGDRSQVASQLDLNQYAMNQLIYRNPEVLELADGRWITVTKANKIISIG